MSDDAVESLIQWFTRNGGVFDSECVGFRYDDESGRGAFALSDIPEGQVLFTIPRHLLLSTRTCDLREQLGEDAWKRLGAGWAGLILCMMWEQAKGSDGKWSFNTPMFWAADELELLEGPLPLISFYAEKIGKEDAEEEYRSRIVPVIKRTFTIWGAVSSLVVSTSRSGRVKRIMHRRTRKAYDDDDARAPGDLLRRYGHVDSVPLPDGSFGNPADVVEVKASLAVEVVASTSKPDIAKSIDERIDWWLEQGGDELRASSYSFLAFQHFPRVLTQNASVFVIEASTPSLPAELISLLRLLLMPQPEWAKTKMKEKPPKPSLDAELIPVAIKMLVMRLEMYETTLEV
ncbi:hypothetical protein BS47DRAFT_1358373 [Hydnum rufescens UP504]|uniref:Uncharacterized protein n=1 Tax=Hydnum rufescens UP504 TaxID=1448309 RepID=A0A9P6B7V9_9AGAM|nr:hypothetical protein BS47DRAFT_1358373 [Hydnum rufescens UP504]